MILTDWNKHFLDVDLWNPVEKTKKSMIRYHSRERGVFATKKLGLPKMFAYNHVFLDYESLDCQQGTTKVTQNSFIVVGNEALQKLLDKAAEAGDKP